MGITSSATAKQEEELRDVIRSGSSCTLRLLLHDDLYDQQDILNKLLQNNWCLSKVVGLGDPNLTKIYMEKNTSIDINCYDPLCDSPVLHKVVFYTDIDHVKLFLDHNADPNVLDVHSQTPLYYVYVNYYSRNLMSARAYKNQNDKLEIMKLLIERGARAVTKRYCGNDILHVQTTLMYGNLEAVKCVLELDINFRQHYDEGNTLLHYLSKNKDPRVLKMIRGKCFNVNACNDLQETPLWWATKEGLVTSVEFLLREGADVNIKDNQKSTPLDVAIRCCTGDPNAYNPNGDHAEDYVKLIKILLENGANIELSSELWDTNTFIDLMLQRSEKFVLYKVALKRLAVQQSRGGRITARFQIVIDSNIRFQEYLNACREVLKRKLNESETLLDLLNYSDKKLMLHMRNKERAKNIQDFVQNLKLNSDPYGDLLVMRVTKACRTLDLRYSAALFISELFDVDYDGYSLVIDIIVSYLNYEDMNVLMDSLA